MYIYILVGGFNQLEKYESQWEGLSHILWKIKNVPNHQPDMYIYNIIYIYIVTDLHLEHKLFSNMFFHTLRTPSPACEIYPNCSKCTLSMYVFKTHK